MCASICCFFLSFFPCFVHFTFLFCLPLNCKIPYKFIIGKCFSRWLFCISTICHLGSPVIAGLDPYIYTFREANFWHEFLNYKNRKIEKEHPLRLALFPPQNPWSNDEDEVKQRNGEKLEHDFLIWHSHTQHRQVQAHTLRRAQNNFTRIVAQRKM